MMVTLLVIGIVLMLMNAVALLCVFGVLRTLSEEIDDMSEALDNLTAQVAASNSAVDSAVTLINTLADEIRNNVDDSAALNALADSLNAKSSELANAVVANTPAQTAPAGNGVDAGGAGGTASTGLPDGTSATPPVEPSPTGEAPTPEAPAPDVPPSNPDE